MWPSQRKTTGSQLKKKVLFSEYHISIVLLPEIEAQPRSFDTGNRSSRKTVTESP